MAEERRLFSVFVKVISSSGFEVKCTVLRHDWRLTFLYIEKTWIPMQWCWSNPRCGSYPVVFVISSEEGWSQRCECCGSAGLPWRWSWPGSVGPNALCGFDSVKQIKWDLLWIFNVLVFSLKCLPVHSRAWLMWQSSGSHCTATCQTQRFY